MNTLEIAVRGILANDQKKRTLDYLTPENKEHLIDGFYEIIKESTQVLFGEDASTGDEELDAHYAAETKMAMHQMLSDGKLSEATAYWQLDSEGWRDHIYQQVNAIKMIDPENTVTLDDIEMDIEEKLQPAIQKREDLVAYLTEISREEGIEAVDAETISEAVRKVYGTKEEFVDHQMTVLRGAYDILQKRLPGDEPNAEARKTFVELFLDYYQKEVVSIEADSHYQE